MVDHWSSFNYPRKLLFDAVCGCPLCWLRPAPEADAKGWALETAPIGAPANILQHLGTSSHTLGLPQHRGIPQNCGFHRTPFSDTQKSLGNTVPCRIPQWPVASPTLKSSPSTPCSMSTFILGSTMDPCCDACVTLQTAFLPKVMQPKSQLWQEGRIRGCHRSCCHNHIALLVTCLYSTFQTDLKIWGKNHLSSLKKKGWYWAMLQCHRRGLPPRRWHSVRRRVWGPASCQFWYTTSVVITL